MPEDYLWDAEQARDDDMRAAQRQLHPDSWTRARMDRDEITQPPEPSDADLLMDYSRGTCEMCGRASHSRVCFSCRHEYE